MYLCKKCGYLGPLAIEWVDEKQAAPPAWNPEAGEEYPAPWYAKLFALWYVWYVVAICVMGLIFIVLWLSGL